MRKTRFAKVSDMSHSESRNAAFFERILDEKLNEMEKWMEDLQNQEVKAKQFLEEIEEEDFDKFKEEYQKILRVLKRSKQRSVITSSKYNDAKAELTMGDHQIQATGKLEHDAQTLKLLRQQILRAENLFLAIAKREDAAKFEARQLKQDIANLNNTLKQGVGLSAAQERTINELVATKEQCTKDFENELEKIVSLRNGFTSISERIESMEFERKTIEMEIISLKDKNTAKKREIDQEMKNKEKLERDLRDLRVFVTVKSQEAVGKQGSVNRATEDILQIENQIRHQKGLFEKLFKDQELLEQRTVKIQQDYDGQLLVTQEVFSINEESIAELKIKERELLSHKHEVRRVTKIKEAFLKKSRLLEEQKLQAENERKVHRANNEALNIDIEKRKKSVEVFRKTSDDLRREKDILEGSVKKSENETSRLQMLLSYQKQQQASREQEIARNHRELSDNQKAMNEYKEDIIKGTEQIELLEKQANDGIFALKEKEVQIFEYKRLTLQSENKLKYQQNLYEAVQSDRKLHSKKLVDSHILIANMKKKLKIMNFQINGFKEDANSKEAMLVKETAQMVKLGKDFDLTTDEIKNLKGQNELAAAYIKTQMTEEYKLDQFVKEAEVERDRQQKSLDLIITERDNLLSQLLHRNQELTIIYDKIKTQSLTLLRGEMNYKEKMIEIRNVRREISDNKMKHVLLACETAQLPVMRKQIIQIENHIIENETRIKALEQELENPINVHRWRKLEGSQPQAYEMILLLQTLQKQVILKNKEECEKSNAIAIKEKLYLHLKTILAKQTGPEASQQVDEFKLSLKDKNKQLRHMDTELNMYKAQVQEYQHSIGIINTGLADLKKQFLSIYTRKLKDPFANVRDFEICTLPPLPTLPFDGVKSESNHFTDKNGSMGSGLELGSENNKESNESKDGDREKLELEQKNSVVDGKEVQDHPVDVES
jgi:hypothetical protein